MAGQAKYLLVSLPTSITPSNDREEALSALQAAVSSDYGTVYPFQIPEFKIGTLDALVQQADELSKLQATCEGVVSKVGDSLKNILEGDEEKISNQKTVNDSRIDRQILRIEQNMGVLTELIGPVDQYLRTFSWNRVKYRADKPLSELIDALQKEVVSIDNDVKNKFSQYNQVKTNLTALQRKQTGNLSTRSLAPLVNPSLLVQDSEYLETHLVAVPTQSVKEFLRSYETVSPMVVPRSSIRVTSDDEYTLYAVTTFKKHSQEFVHKCRERKWTPRDFKYKEGGKEEEQQEIDRMARDEKKLWGEALRLGRTGWGESVMVMIHCLALRVFVETVLRYGLPLEFICGLVKTTPKFAKKAKFSLDTSYSYLGGNAVGRDKKGRITKDDPAVSSEMAAAGHVGDAEYTAYVYYEFEIN